MLSFAVHAHAQKNRFFVLAPQLRAVHLPLASSWNAVVKNLLNEFVYLYKTCCVYLLENLTQNKNTIMVCEKCEKKLGKVITPDPWKAGARNTTEGGGRKVNENKALTAKTARFAPYSTFEKCRVCRQKVHQPGSHYCQACAYKKGICAMCGKKLLDIKNYKQSSA